MFLLHNEEEREDWISAIKKLQPKGKPRTMYRYGDFVACDFVQFMDVHVANTEQSKCKCAILTNWVWPGDKASVCVCVCVCVCVPYDNLYLSHNV